MIFQQFIDQNNNKGLDFDGYYGDQCVDLAQFYNRDVLGNNTIFTGNAVDIFGQQADKFTWIANTPAGVPQNGDIVIWDGSLNGGPGHVAVFISGNATNFTSFDQNWPTGSFCHQQSHTYNYVKGWGHPKANQSQEEEVITAADTATVRIINSEVKGYPFDDTHKGKFDTQEMGAWTGKPWTQLIDEGWAGAEAFRNTRNQEMADYPKLVEQNTALTKQVADLQTGGSLDSYSLGQLLSAAFAKLFKVK